MYYSGGQQPGLSSQTAKTCSHNHPLIQTPGEYRNYPPCNRCGIKKLMNAYSCAMCNYDLCQNCFSSPYIGKVNVNLGTQNLPISGQQSMKVNSTCINNHPLTQIHGEYRNYPFCKRCGSKNLMTVFSCVQCDYNLCQGCYSSPFAETIKTSEEYKTLQKGQPTSMEVNQACINNHPLIQTLGQYRNFPTCYLCGTKSQMNVFSCAQCNYDICQSCYSSKNRGSSFTSNYPGFSGLSSHISPSQTQGMFQSTQMSNQGVEYKKCPNNHYLTLCNSQMRHYPSCNTCGKSNLNHSWTCFNCDWDMCLNCYDTGNLNTTEKIKVCNKGHALIHTDKFNRPNVTCDKCGKKNIPNQFSCLVCDYDECIKCHEGRPKFQMTTF